MHPEVPRCLRRLAAIVLLALAAIAGTLVASVTPAAAADAAEQQMLQLTNASRNGAGLGSLQLVESLNGIAEEWSASMAAQGTLSHRPDLASRVSAVAPNWTRLGENVGVGGTLEAIQQAFMNSSGHRANILGAYNYVGIGVVGSGGRLWVTVVFVNSATPLTSTPTAPSDQVSLVRPDGSLATAPDLTAARGGARLDTVVVGTDGDVYWSGSVGGGFSGWRSIGRPSVGVTGEPALVSWIPGRLDVFVRGGDNRLWQRFSTDTGGTWSGWFQPLGADGVLASSPEVSSWAPGRLDITILGTNGRIYQRFYEGGWNHAWLDQGAPPAGVDGAPTAASWAPGRMDIFVRGDDDRLWQRFWDGRGWSAWIRPPGDTGVLGASPAAASSAPGRLSIATRGTDGGVYVLTYDGRWSGWRRIGLASHTIVGRPSATSRGGGELVIAGSGSDTRAYLFVTTG